MPTTTFTQPHSGSGNAFPTVTVSGITGTVTGIDYTVNFNASNPSQIYASVIDPDNTNQSLFGTGTIATGSPPYTYTEAANSLPVSVNGQYDFSVRDQFGFANLQCTSVEVAVTYTSPGTDYQLTVDDAESSSQASDTDVDVVRVEIDGEDIQSNAQASNVDVQRQTVDIVAEKAESQAEASDVDVFRDLGVFSLESQSVAPAIRMYDKRQAIRTVHFW